MCVFGVTFWLESEVRKPSADAQVDVTMFPNNPCRGDVVKDTTSRSTTTNYDFAHQRDESFFQSPFEALSDVI